MNITNKKISLFRTCFDRVPCGDIEFKTFYLFIRDNIYADQIAAIRAEKDKEKRDQFKSKLPAVTVSGTFTRRRGDCLVNHSGLICLDFDGKDNPDIKDWNTAKEEIASCNEVALAALSSSGKGMFAVIALQYPEYHVQQFEALQIKIAELLNLIIDPACRDISRLRYFTFDPDVYVNFDPVPFPLIMQHERKEIKSIDDKDDRDLQLINKIIESGIDITESYQHWYQVGAALASEYGENGRDLFHQLSQAHPKYKTTECDKQYDACLKNPGGYTLATVFYYAKEKGVI